MHANPKQQMKNLPPNVRGKLAPPFTPLATRILTKVDTRDQKNESNPFPDTKASLHIPKPWRAD